MQSGPPASRPSPFATEQLPGVGDLVGGHYRLVRLLGEGMFGKVYVAERVDVPAHQVALKLVPREVYSGRNVERELVMLAAASHPNIVQLKDHGTTEGYVWLTMPVYEGETLSDRLERTPLSLEDAHEIFLPIARALDALHKAGLRHQDIKPENIFLATFAGRLHPILLDLGVAAETSAPFVAGTILYASPEQLSALSQNSASLPLSDKMDTYCLASTLLRSIVGAEHFPGEGAESRLEIVTAQAVRAHQPLLAGALPGLEEGVRKRLGDAFCRWLDPDPETRPPVAVMADELDILLEPERDRVRAAERRRARWKAAARAGLVAAVVFGGAGAFYVYSKRETLRLAADLSRARAEGAASFDKLDTCVASHQVAQREVSACREAKSQQQVEFQSMLGQIAKSGGANEATLSRQIQTLQGSFTTRLKTCEDEASLAAQGYALERDRLIDDSQRKEAQLVAERDEQLKALEARAGDLERCRSDLARESAEFSAERATLVEKLAAAEHASAVKGASVAGPAGGGADGGGPATTSSSEPPNEKSPTSD